MSEERLADSNIDWGGIFRYVDGELWWRNQLGNKSRDMLNPVGTIDGGYLRVKYNSKMYYVHRIVYITHHGSIDGIIDHIDRDRSNNQLCNLRDTTHSENCANSRICSRNTSGYKGVHWVGSRSRWRARISVNGRNASLGSFKSIVDAVRVFNLASRMYHGEYSFINDIKEEDVW